MPSRRSALAALLALPAILSRPARAAEFSYKYASNLPPAHPLNVYVGKACARIREKSGGRLDITLYPNNQLGGDTEVLAQLRSGALEFFTLSGPILATLVPVAAINGVGYAFKDYGQVWAAMDGPVGAIVRGINFAEVYSALETHIVDGQENPLAIIETAKLYEVQKYLSFTNHMWDGYWMLANPDAYHRLPEALQTLVAEEFNAAALEQRAAVAAMNASLGKTLAERGMVLNETDPAPFREALRKAGFYAEWRKRLGDPAWSALEQVVGTLA
jgi:TRAP-type C4-dicarboxylate transport system substrate-binding protein